MHHSRIRPFLCSALLLCSSLLVLPISAGAVEINISGLWQFRPFSWAQRNLEKGNPDDRFRAANRLRSQVDIIASENLRGVLAFQVGHQNWGVQSQGAALGTDGKVFAIRRSYVDWTVPEVGTRVRMGLQLFELPSFTSIGSPIVNTNAAGVTLSQQFNEQITGTVFWTRLENNNVAISDEPGGSQNPHDAMDFAGFTLPVETTTFRATPWAMYGIVGRDSLKNAGFGQTTLQSGMVPLGSTAALAGKSDKARGYSWYAGIASQWRPLNDLKFALDAAYGSVDIGRTTFRDREYDIKRAGWYAALLAEYTLEFGTPGLVFWYSSGDDGNGYNGSERLPSIWPDMTISSYGSDLTWYGGAALTLGYGLSGTWATMFRINDMSFLEKLSHNARFIYYQGTNNKEMVRQRFISNPQASLASFTYLTTGDRALEVNFDSNYKIYKDLTLSLELGYIRLNLDEALWKAVGYEANKNNYKCTLSLNYRF